MINLILLFGAFFALGLAEPQCNLPESMRFDCNPEEGASQQTCESRGCCWQSIKSSVANVSESVGLPYCFYPVGYPSYSMSKVQETSFGLTANLTRDTTGYYPKDVMNLMIDVYFETESRLHFKIYDPSQKRYEVPIATPRVTKKEANPRYKVSFTEDLFGISVTRVKTGAVIFNTSISTSAFIYANQFIQISSMLASGNVYGLGEHTTSFALSNAWTNFPMWTKDEHPSSDKNLYGQHPFFLALEPDAGTAYGVFLLNSNAMDVTLSPAPAVTYRTIGGILDFYIFLGPSPSEVIQQYTEVIGRPFHPPYWGLGFHLCRWGYNSATRTQEIVQKMRQLRIPQDTQWNDIDYMISHLDFTYDPRNYQQLPQLVSDLHSNGQHYIIMLDVQWNDIEYAIGRRDFTLNNSSFAFLPKVIEDLHSHGQFYIPIVDPAIGSSEPAGTYAPYDTGVKQDIFIKDASGQILIGKVWPGATAFPDFTNPATESWWESNIVDFHKKVPFDGIWLDMNEPSNFVNGDVANCPDGGTYDNPPYVPDIRDRDINSHSLCASANQYAGLHYNVHSLYGISEVNMTNKILSSFLKKRPFIISRSTFPSSGKYGGHWLGDNNSTWLAMRESIPGVLAFNLFGIPLVGADICGFELDTTEELCVRWQQLGAFYPFSRNHNSIRQRDQDPTQWSKAGQDAIRSILETRYSLLPYLYTLLTEAHINGTTVARPLLFEYPNDPLTYTIDRQFLWGPSLLISPVLDQGSTSVTALFPAGVWYDFYQGSNITNQISKMVTLDAPLDTIPLHIREGYILPMQGHNMTTTYSRRNPFQLLGGLNSQTETACGWLYWDDGESLGTYSEGKYIQITFEVIGSKLITEVVHNNYSESSKMTLGSITLYGVTSEVQEVTINGKDVSFKYDAAFKKLVVSDFSVRFDQPVTMKWM